MAAESLELTSRSTITEAIWQMDEEDLRFLNRLIVERLKFIGEARNMAMLARFSVGDRVSFQSHSGELKIGVIIRLNKKSASITTDDGQHWKVHPVYLSPAVPVSSGNREKALLEREPATNKASRGDLATEISLLFDNAGIRPNP